MGSNKKILLIDDDRDFVESNTDLLEAYGYTVCSAFGGEEGFQKASEELPDLIVLDVMMAYNTEGLDVARKIHNEPSLKGTKVLLVSGIAKEMKLSKPLSPDETWLPVTRVMDKPIDPARFIYEIGQLIGKV